MSRRTGQNEYFARCASGFEDVLAAELKRLGLRQTRTLKGGVSFPGDDSDGLRACLWSRVATRIQLVIARVNARDAEALYAGARAIPWETLIAPGATIAMRAHGQNAALRNTQFTALKVKDAVCDRLAAERGQRPDVDGADPDFPIDIALHRDKATILFNLSGTSLHQRGYREPGVQTEAPLKETLAAGLLLAAGWHAMLADGMGFADPMCGSGTLAIEAALIATNTAPGLLRNRWGFASSLQHDPAAWDRLIAEAQETCIPSWETGMRVLAGDTNAEAVEIARANAKRAGMDDLIEFFVDDAANLGTHMKRGRNLHGGLVAVNPPYGHRLFTGRNLADTYAALAAGISKLGAGWQLAAITPDAGVDSGLGRVPHDAIACYNGPLSTTVRIYDLGEEPSAITVTSLAGAEQRIAVAERGSDQFAARLRKVAKERAKWARKSGVLSYRVYDADLPEFAFSVDLFRGAENTVDDTAGNNADAGNTNSNANNANLFVRVEEHPSGSKVDAARADRRFFDALSIIPAVLDVPSSQVFHKRARRDPNAPTPESHWANVREDRFTFEIDLASPRECGLPLDMRPVRELVRNEAQGRRFACLLAHGGAYTTYAASGEATSTVTVDPSKTYVRQAQNVMHANGFNGRNHAFVCSDVMEWIRDQARAGTKYGLVFCDLSAFPASRDTDLGAEGQNMVERIADILDDDGKLVLACKARKFELDEQVLAKRNLAVRDITSTTIGHDFERTPRIHRAFLIERES